MSTSVLALRMMAWRPTARPADMISAIWLSAIAPRFSGLTSTPIRIAFGASSLSSPNCFGISVVVTLLTPVRLPPGRLKLATRPASTGSPPILKTIGIVEVDALAACAEASPPLVTITATLRETRSWTSSGRRSYRPSAHRNSIATFLPSTKPVSLKPCRKADSIGPSVTGDLPLKYPITGIGCCARAARGHAAAAPPSSVMNWRRLMSSMGSSPEPAVPAYRRLRMPRKRPQVLGVDLNCSESRRGAAGRFPPEPLISAPLRVARQAEGEDRTLARLACHCHIAAHHPREFARDSEPEPRSPEALSGRGIGLAELLEQLCLLLRGHPDAGVGDGELDDVAAIAHFACRKLDLARFGELTRIAQQVQKYLPQPHGVHRQCAEVLLDFNDEAVLILLGKLSRGADDLIDQRCELHGLWIEFELSGLDLRQIEHLVDEAKKVSTSAVHALQRFQRLFRAEARRVGDHHLGQPDDGVERRAQLVAHTGKELRLALARQFELAALVLLSYLQRHLCRSTSQSKESRGADRR